MSSPPIDTMPPSDSDRSGDSTQDSATKKRIAIGTQRAGVPVPRLPPRHMLVGQSQPSSDDSSLSLENAPLIAHQQEIAPETKPSTPKAHAIDTTAHTLGPASGGVVSPLKVRPTQPAAPSPKNRVEIPNLRLPLEADLEADFESAFEGISLDSLLLQDPRAGIEKPLQAGSRVMGVVLSVGSETIFIDLGNQRQGALDVMGLENIPSVGDPIEVSIGGKNEDDDLYEVALAGRAVSIDDWSQLEAGLIVEARVTGINKGGLECEVAGLRGFMPTSLISTWRVENLNEFIGQKFECLVTELVPSARKLVLSRRAVLEKNSEDARRTMLETLEVGAILEGIVRTVRDFGAFVDIQDGVEGLVHVSQLSWEKIGHPSDVVAPGQRVKVVIRRIDHQTGKIALSMRDLVESPWTTAASRFGTGQLVRGTVSRIAEFGAFVRLEPGIEGLIHVSELSHRNIRSVSDIVIEGQEIECRVLSIDPDAQRMSLSLKALAGREIEDDSSVEQPAKAAIKRGNQPLKGGLGGTPMGERFGLKW